jgi:hypothetical protein
LGGILQQRPIGEKLMAKLALKKTVVSGKTDTPEFADYFGQSHQGYHLQGKDKRDLFTEVVEDFFSRFKHHVYIAGQPGVGKTHTVRHTADRYPNLIFVPVNQSMTPWAFVKMVAVACFTGRMTNKQVAFYIDDFNAIFKANSEFLDMFKNAMDKRNGDRLEYNKSLGAQYDQADDIEKQAIDYFRELSPDRTGFVIPFEGKVKFIFTMNTPLPGAVELAKEKEGTDKWIKINNRSAIRSRVNYEDLVMTKPVYWGWIADVLWHEPNIAVGSTADQKFEMLMWLWDNWDSASEHSLRFIEEKLWDIMEQYPKPSQYRPRWEKLKG